MPRTAKEGKRYSSDEPNSPPYRGDELGNDPAKKPDEGFEWKSKGNPESGKGSWYKGETDERLYLDLKHPEGKDPHWDYSGSKFPGGSRLFLDGTWERK
ncbi:MAG: hypothetical protein K2X69_13540 [Silvanigrellaceae bacterium]|nr:hypothetical protein [Silvanigrellaceae bacterium]